jgi:hypothetical protein
MQFSGKGVFRTKPDYHQGHEVTRRKTRGKLLPQRTQSKAAKDAKKSKIKIFFAFLRLFLAFFAVKSSCSFRQKKRDGSRRPDVAES